MIFALIALSFLHSSPASAEQSSLVAMNTSFIVYCTSNQDGTGQCSRVDTSENIDCEIVPGAIINCSPQSMPPVQCVLVSAIMNAQAYFSCSQKRSPSLGGNRLNVDRFAEPTPSAPSSVITPDLPETLTPLAPSFN